MAPRSSKTSPAAASSPASAEPPRVGDTLAALRQAQSLSLDALSRKAGVSKSMLSQIERAQANPTVAVVWRLANALGVPLGDLLGAPPPPAEPAITVVPAHATPSLRNPDGACELRILGPIELAGQFEWYALSLKGGGALESQAHEDGTREHLTVFAGTLEVTAGDSTQRLSPGETARYAADRPHVIRNVGKTEASAWLVVLHPV
ncbi:helix-turn-helix domain-containing protein [Rhodoferax sp.]|uniref:helix-turn-helix domain-containing protein n=1 Tax=Rhodoferax sp. TaxID=50421 RepID=UPI00374CB9B1